MTLSFGMVLRRGMLAGVAAGVASSLVLLLVVEPHITTALGIEEGRAHASGEAHHEELFSRTTQLIGGVVAAMLVGLAIGTLFAVVFASVRHRLPAHSDLGRSVQLAAAGFLVVSLLPGLKYPANPPGVGDPETVNERTLAYLSLIAAGMVVLALAGYLDKALRGRDLAPHHRASIISTVSVLLFVVLLLVWPAGPDAIPADVPAGLLWEFRLSSLAALGAMWFVLGHVFGLLLQRRPAPLSRETIAA